MDEKQSADKFELGSIREELQLLIGAPTVTGKPTWMIFDPVQHRYFEIDFEVYETLSLWNRFENGQQIIDAALKEQGRELTMRAVAEIAAFIDQNSLSLEPANGGWRAFNARLEKRKVSPFTWMIHNYLFIKVPLVRPSRFLKAAFPYVSFLFTRTMMWITLVVAMSGLYLVSRQWDEFLSTFANFFSFEGAITYAIALVIIKVLHELGHAFMAVRFGCRVPTMGVAFLVMFPVLFTDVTDAWKLRRRRQRLLIGAAGMMVELSIASYATFFWAFLPEGGMKSIAFVVATISWVMSVAVNLNPLMRFDGYYLMSDSLAIANLQTRAFGVGRWRLREVLFNLGSPPPERLPSRTIKILAWYAWAIWVYRFFLFIGIALLVYTFAFKVLGVVLFFIEIIWFIARPFWSEIKEWPAMSKQIFSHLRVYLSLSVAAGIMALIVLPVSGRIDVPALIEPARFERLFPERPAKLIAMPATPERGVIKGDVLFRFEAPELDRQLELVNIKIALVKARMARAVADADDKTELQPLKQELSTLETTRAGLRKEELRLIVRAPFTGYLKDLNPDLHVGRWVSATEHLATVTKKGSFVAKGYVTERDLWRIKNGDKGEFVPDDFLVASSKVSVKEIALSSASKVELKPLSSVFGGKVSTRKRDDGTLVPVGALYQVTLAFSKMPNDTTKVSRGIVHIHGVPESVAARIWRQVLRVLVRESGA